MINGWHDASTDRPASDTFVIILTDSDRIVKGYMRAKKWLRESKLTYSFHGEYYDVEKGKYVYCLVNAVAWIPMPPSPDKFKIKRQTECSHEFIADDYGVEFCPKCYLDKPIKESEQEVNTD